MSTDATLPENRKVVLRNYPAGLPGAENFALETEPARAPGEGEILVAVRYLSLDAWIGTTLSPGWLHELIPLGSTVGAFGVGHVVASGDPRFDVGDAVTGNMGAQTHALAKADECQKIDDKNLPITAWLGLLAVTTGLTAYFGMRDIGQVQPGETVVVSAAAGAVGSVAGQIAKIDGGRVIGIAGGPAKCEFLVDKLGFDGAIDYKGEDVDARLKELAPDGVDVFFDNVGGEILDSVLDQIRERARVVICGAISQYDDNANVHGPKRYLRLAERYARMEGYTVLHFQKDFPKGLAQLSEWIQQEKIWMPEQIEEGIDSFPRALEMLFSGGNTGKLLVRV
jgi:NADPH-dependent curcumin reductase CurA